MEVVTIPVTPLQCNCYIVMGDGGACVVIDPGGDAEDILAELRRQKATPRILALTHGHADHIGALDALHDAFPDAERICGVEAKAFLNNGRLNLSPFLDMQLPPLAVDRTVSEGDTIEIPGLCLSVLEAPGHTPGDLVFTAGDPPDVAFVGDVIFAGGVGRVDLPGSSEQKLVSSIRTKIYTLPDGCALYPGHGPPTNVADEKGTNPFVRPD